MECFSLYADGASRGNPGKAGVGVICLQNEKKIFEISQYIGIATNNVAEYTALLVGCKKFKELVNNIQNIQLSVFLDSQLVVEQMKGKYKVKNVELKKIHKEIKNTIQDFHKITFQHIYRDDNVIADNLANLALDNL